MESGELPEVYERNGNLYRKVKRVSAGEEWESERPVARTLEEAQALRWDFYHLELGWILSGYKLEKDRDTDSIMADGSHASPLPIEEQEKRSSSVRIVHS